MGDSLGVDLSAATEADFAPGAGPLHELGLDLQLWASYRGQLLVRGFRALGFRVQVEGNNLQPWRCSCGPPTARPAVGERV